MNKQEALFFEALSKDRSEIADVLERRAVRGYKDSVVEKYSDQAHFIYELLQNADDACATNARFILEENRLIFAHNGTRHFFVSNPANEDIDSERKTLGDINAITSIANSNKTGASIGKFGVGFKAVFQYTSTPHIYDPSFKFDQKGRAVAAFDEDNQLILFLPVKNVDGYTVVNDELLKNEETKKYIESIGVKQPSLKDQIYNIILPQYKDGIEIDTDPHFMIFFNFYCKCSNEEIEEFIDLIKDCEFLTYYEDGVAYRGKASEMYMPTQNLLRYFASKPTTRFIDLQGYKEMVGKEREKYLTSFLIELGVKTSPRTYMENDDGYYHRTSEKFVDGLLEIIAAVEETKNEDLSAFLWEQMCVLADESMLGYYVLNKTVRSRPDGRYNFRTEYVASATKEALIEKLWLVNNEGVFVSAEELTKRDLSSIYDLDLDGAASLLSLLDISDVVEVEDEDEDDSNLTDEQREKIAF